MADRLAAQGVEVRRIRRPLPPAREFARDPLWTGVTHVFHLAARTRAPRPADLFVANVDFTEHLAEAALTHAAVTGATVPRFVFVSSLAAMGPAPAADTPVTTAQRPAPVEAYGVSKRVAEERLQGMTNLPLVIVRPAAVYGPRDRDFATVFRQVRHPLQLRATPGWHRLTLASVHDVVSAIIAAALVPEACADAARAGYLIGGDEVTWDALYDLIDLAVATAFGGPVRRAPSVTVPAPLLTIAGTVGAHWARLTGRTPLATPDKITLGAQPWWTCRDDALRQDTGWAPQVPLMDGLVDTATSYRRAGWL